METPTGDAIVIRHKMFLSLSYDHRIIDGALGGAFLRKIADNLNNLTSTVQFKIHKMKDLEIPKIYTIKNTQRKSCQMVFIDDSRPRYDNKAPNYLKQAIGCRIMRLMQDTMGFNWPSVRFLKKIKTISFLIIAICSRLFPPE
jgi:hypothetical protein